MNQSVSSQRGFEGSLELSVVTANIERGVSMGRIGAFIQLARIQSSGLSAMFPVLGFILAVYAGPGWDPFYFWPVIVLFCSGIFMHIYGYVQNELLDQEYDRGIQGKINKPLIEGTVTNREALTFCLVAIGATAGLVVFAGALVTSKFTWCAYGLLTLSFVFGSIYNRFSKQYPGIDIFMALWAFCFVLCGAFIVTESPPPIVYLVALLCALEILFVNMISGGIKDVNTDRASGVRNVAVLWGVQAVPGGKKRVGPMFWTLGFLIKLFTGVVVVSTMLLPQWSNNYFVYLLAFILGYMMFTSMSLMDSLHSWHPWDRSKFIIGMGIVEIFTFSTTILLIIPWVGWPWLMIIPFSIIWLVVWKRVMVECKMVNT